MLRPRVIPCLLLMNQGLVKTIKFKKPQYVGDPINTVKIFNEKEVDEIIFLDITASFENRYPDIPLIERIASECFMPLCYGGGIRDIETIKRIFNIGVEKVSLNAYALENENFIRAAADIFGSQSIVVAMDVKKNFYGKYEVYKNRGKKRAKIDPVEYAIKIAQLGGGEILLNSIDRDGCMEGYDLDLLKRITRAVDLPVIALGGAGKYMDFEKAIGAGGALAVAAGSFFVFHGKLRSVLITYPSPEEIDRLAMFYEMELYDDNAR